MRTLVGDIPAGWSEVLLGEVCGLVTGANVSPEASGEDVPLVKPRNIGDGRLIEEPDRITGEAAAALSRYRLAAGDVVCVRTGGIGRHALVASEHEGWLFGTGVIRLRPERIDSRYLNRYLSHPLVQDWLRRNAAGSAIPSISGRALGTLPVALPPIETQREIGEILGVLDEKIAVYEQISRVTAELRDTLLSRFLDDSDGTTESRS
ncbi:restriction endonuclease subunit S [Streptosporangium saharense]|uniref:restriction endonuclease subunit S n=1 Tax=Streptosporangium saharense TaxID=1706840 RepID=UPI003321FA40